MKTIIRRYFKANAFYQIIFHYYLCQYWLILEVESYFYVYFWSRLNVALFPLSSACNVGDEGGFAPNILDNFEALNLLMEAIDNAGYNGKIHIGMDVAASEFCKDGKYDLSFKDKTSDPSTYVSFNI